MGRLVYRHYGLLDYHVRIMTCLRSFYTDKHDGLDELIN